MFALILQSSYLDVVLGSGQGQEKQWQNNNEERRIYSVTDGLKAKQTAKVYRSTFKEFIKYLQNVDLRVLLDFRLDIIESKIISYLEYLRDVRKPSFWSVQVHYSAIHHFFEINGFKLTENQEVFT
jgi:predicted metal-dependent HD superfamily phosphohydrolase